MRPALEALAQHESAAVRLAAVIALRRMRHAGVARFLSDADERIVTDAARAINDDGGIEAALPALAAVLKETRFKSEPLLRRAISANLRVGSNEAAERVAAFAADSQPRRRACASKPSRCSACGRRRRRSIASTGITSAREGQQGRDGTAARAAVRRLIEPAPEGDVDAGDEGRAGRSGRPARDRRGRPDPARAAEERRRRREVRVASLRALQALKVPDIDQVMKIALADKDPAVRKAALGILPGLAMSSAAKVQQLSVADQGRFARRAAGRARSPRHAPHRRIT